ncbi:MAG: metallophosphoesterase family protein [Rhodospirillaceae bacterium]
MTDVRAKHLGDLDGPVLLFGGPYSNLQATRALRQEADRLGIPAGRVICTGDVVAYCADADGTIDEVRDWGCHAVMGNCEEALSEGGDDCRCGFEKGSECDLLSVRWFTRASARITDDQRAWMGALPHPVTFKLAGRRMAVIHGHARDISEWIFASTPEAEKQAAFDALDADGIIAGHSGLPFTQTLPSGRMWHNPGVIGMPANDGTARAWYSVLTPREDHLAIRHVSLDYDHTGAAQAMADAGLPGAYADSLMTGLWPNLDVLPSAERAATGTPIQEWEITWEGQRRTAA